MLLALQSNSLLDPNVEVTVPPGSAEVYTRDGLYLNSHTPTISLTGGQDLTEPVDEKDLFLTGYIPVVNISVTTGEETIQFFESTPTLGLAIAVPAGSLTFNEQTPTINLTLAPTTPVTSLVIGEQTPVRFTNFIRGPPVVDGSLALTGQAPKLFIDTVTPGAGSLSFNEKTPAFAVGFSVSTPYGFMRLRKRPALSLDTYTPTPVVGTPPLTKTPAEDDLVLTGKIPTVEFDYYASPARAYLYTNTWSSLRLAGHTPVTFTGQLPIEISVTERDLTLTGQTPTLNYSVSVGDGSLTITEQDVTVAQTWSASPGAGSLTITEQDVTVAQTWSASPGAGSLAINEQDVTIAQTWSASPPAGSLDIAGYIPELKAPNTELPPAGTLDLTGYVPIVNQTLSADPGEDDLLLDGKQPALNYGIAVPAGSLVITEQAGPTFSWLIGPPAVRNGVPSALSNTTASILFQANLGSIETGEYCVHDGQVIPLELMQDANVGGTSNTGVRIDHKTTTHDPAWNDAYVGVPVVFSFYAREAGLPYLNNRWIDDTVSNYDAIDLSNGSIVVNDPDTDIYITAVDGGYRVEFVRTGVSEGDNRWLDYLYLSEDGTTHGNVNSDGTSSVWIGGFQLEYGVTRASKLAYNRKTSTPIDYRHEFGGTLALSRRRATLNQVLTPAAQTLDLTGYIPSVEEDHVSSPPAGTLTLTGVIPDVLDANSKVPLVGSLTATGQEPTANVTHSAAPGAGSLTITEQAGPTFNWQVYAPYYQHTNLLPYSEDFSSWSALGTLTITPNTDVGLDGKTTADDLDDTGASYGYVQQLMNGEYVSGEKATGFINVKKDAVGKATRFVMFRLRTGGAAARLVDMMLDTSTGEFVAGFGAGVTNHGSGVIDKGDYWRIWATMDDGNVGNDDFNIQFYPAVGAGNLDSGNYSVATTGSAVAWGAQVHLGDLTGYIPTNGAAVTRSLKLVSEAPTLDETFLRSTPDGSLTLDGKQPSTRIDYFSSIAEADLTLAGQAPSVEEDHFIAVAEVDLTLAGQAPNASVDSTLEPGAGAATLTGYAPDQTTSIRVAGGSLSLTGYIPLRLSGGTVAPVEVNLTLTGGDAPSITRTVTDYLGARLRLVRITPRRSMQILFPRKDKGEAK